VNMTRIAVLVLALAAAGLAAFLARNMVSAPGEPTKQVAETPTAEVLVAAADIALGSRVSKGSLRWQVWPEEAITSAYITRKSRPDGMDQFAGTIARSPLLDGEPVTSGKLVSFEDAGFMSALIGSGMRAVSTKISPETGAGGFILPNDRVDVIVTERRRSSGSEGGSSGFHTETILTNVRVLAIDQRFKEVEGEQVVVGKTATLELTPGQAESLALGSAQGDIALSLRSLADSGATPEDLAAQNSKSVGTTVRIVRYGTPSTERAKAGAK